MDDSSGRGYDTEVGECLAAPAQKLVPLPVAAKFDFGVAFEGRPAPEKVYLDGMVNHQVYGHQGVYEGGVAAQPPHGRTHGSEVHNRRNAREVLQDDPRGAKRHFAGGGSRGVPSRERRRVFFRDQRTVNISQQIFEQHLD